MKHCPPIIFLAFLSFLIACEEPDTQLPTIEVKVTKNGQIQNLASSVYGTLTIEVTAVDDSNINSIRIIDGLQLLAEISNSNTLSFDWDSRTVPEGKYSLEVSVEDNSGNIAKETLEFEIQNFLMSFSTVDNIGSTSKYYLFLSDMQGNLLDSKYLEDRKEEVVFNRPEIEMESYQLTVISTFNNFYTIETYVSVKPDKYYVKLLLTNSPATVGAHTLIVPDRNSYTQFFLFSEKSTQVTSSSFTQYSIGLSETASNLLLTYASPQYPEPRYYFDSGINVGETTTMDNILVSQFSPMSSVSIDLSTELPGLIAYGVVWGNTQTQSTAISFSNKGFSLELKHYYPPISLFKDYTTEVFYLTKINAYNVSHRLVATATLPSTEKNRLNAILGSLDAYSSNHLKFSATGTADYSHSKLRAFGDNVGVEWNVYAPMQNSTEIKLPTFPDSFLSTHKLEFLKESEFSSITFSDVPLFNTYEEFVSSMLKKDNTGINTAVPTPIRSVTFFIPEGASGG